MSNAPVALVTGSGKRRIGWHVAAALASRGYRLAIHYYTSMLEAEDTLAYFRNKGVEAVALRADLGDESAAGELVAGVIKEFGRIDVLAACAAIWQPKRLEDVSAADVRRHFEVNVLGTFVCAQQAGLAMVGQRDGGCIVTVGDWAEARPYQDYAAYFATKGALPTLTRSLAVELGIRNPRIRVNCVLPGPVMLPADLPDEERRQAIHGTLVKREGRPENVAHTVLFLIDNDFVTGVCLPVDGGRTIYAPP